MIDTLYVEEEVAEHPRSVAIARRLPRARRVLCRRYGEVFNRRAQSFRLQKRRPALLLAARRDRYVLPVPEGHGIGDGPGYSFSHLLNCPFDCRYCFLQGMYRSAHYVLFVDYEGFFEEITRRAATADADTFFFSGYDGDSLALEGLTGFVAAALPVFRRLPRAWLELRTKSVQLAPLLTATPHQRCVVAFSLTPSELSERLEHGVPSVERRLAAMARLAARGWPLGLRFDPLLYDAAYRDRYRRLFDHVFSVLDPASLHSVTLGPFRLPAPYFRTVERLYPEAALFAGPLETRGGVVFYRRQLEEEMTAFCTAELLRRLPPAILFRQAPRAGPATAAVRPA